MERLTFVDEKGRVLFTPKGCGEDVGYTIIQLAEGGHADLLEEIAERLANHEQRLKEYENLEQQGKLLKLPCKLGDITYWIADEDDSGNKVLTIKENRTITGIAVKADGLYVLTEGDEDYQKVGTKWMLLTKSDAESYLQKMNEMEGK